MTDSYFLTGVTGQLGREILANLLRTEPDAEFHCLVRGNQRGSASERLMGVLERLPGIAAVDARGRVHLVEGDIEHRLLHLGEEEWRRLAGRVNKIIHGAATVSFSLPLETARSINVEGARNVLEFAKAAAAAEGGLERLDHFSTCYVAGKRTGIVSEDTFSDEHGFRNTYEQSKFEAEKLVRGEMATLPITIFRPSIILGDSKSGVTTSFKTLYWPLKIYQTGIWRMIPGHSDSHFDMVPIDFVVASYTAIAKHDTSIGKTFALAAGPDHDITAGEIATKAEQLFKRKRVIFADPRWYQYVLYPLMYLVLWGRFRQVVTIGHEFAPYFTSNVRFSIDNTLEFLVGTGIEPVSLREYFTKTFQYSIDSDWGRKDVPLASEEDEDLEAST